MPFLQYSRQYIVYTAEHAVGPNIVSFHLLWETEESYSCSFDVEKTIPQVSWGHQV